MKVGDCVFVRHNPELDEGYLKEARGPRRAHNCRVGRITKFHDSHGYCFDVQFTDMAEVGYDPDELTVITQPEWTNHIRERVGVRMFRALDWLNVTGRGLIAVVDPGGTMPKVGDHARIDGGRYTITGIESGGGQKKIGLVVRKRDEADSPDGTPLSISMGRDVLPPVATVADLQQASEGDKCWVGNPLVQDDGTIHPDPGRMYEFHNAEWLPWATNEELLHGQTPEQWIKEGVPCDVCTTRHLRMDDLGYVEGAAEHYQDGKFMCTECRNAIGNPESYEKKLEEGAAIALHTLIVWIEAGPGPGRITEERSQLILDDSRDLIADMARAARMANQQLKRTP